MNGESYRYKQARGRRPPFTSGALVPDSSGINTLQRAPRKLRICSQEPQELGPRQNDDMFAPLVNNPTETKFIADAAADLVGEVSEAAFERDGSTIEKFQRPL
jgi:hypothetical protein